MSTENDKTETEITGLSDRDYGLVMLSEFDIHAQLMAVRGLLQRHSQSEKETAEEIRALEKQMTEASGPYAHYLDNRIVDRFHDSVYTDAAHSLSAAGMLAPLVESYFTSVFPEIAASMKLDPPTPTAGQRRQRSHRLFWDPHFVFEAARTRNDLVAGIKQLAEEIGLDKLFPMDTFTVFSALFLYRNKVFHYGIEWPAPERRKFLENAAVKSWPSDWFAQSKWNDEPWIIYLNEPFIEKCLDTFEACLTGVGKLIRESYPPTDE